MKRILLASACILALSSAGAIAQQNQPAPGASGQGEVGHDSSKAMKKGTTTGAASGTQDKRGDSKGNVPSGAAGPNTNNMSNQAGGGAGGAGGGAGGAGGGAGGAGGGR